MSLRRKENDQSSSLEVGKLDGWLFEMTMLNEEDQTSEQCKEC